MSAIKHTFISSEDREMLAKFVSVFQKCGNKQRSLSSLFSLFALLKRSIAGYPILSQYPLNTLDENDPIQIINKSLYNLKPAFLIRRTIKSGKRYDLPVPISSQRATFMAMDWMRKIALKNNKNNLSLSFLLAQEISANVYRDGSAQNFLKAYIDIALDQRPFSRFIKRKRFMIAKSKGTKAAARWGILHNNIRQAKRKRKYHTVGITRRINMHIVRGINSRKKRKGAFC